MVVPRMQGAEVLEAGRVQGEGVQQQQQQQEAYHRLGRSQLARRTAGMSGAWHRPTAETGPEVLRCHLHHHSPCVSLLQKYIATVQSAEFCDAAQVECTVGAELAAANVHLVCFRLFLNSSSSECHECVHVDNFPDPHKSFLPQKHMQARQSWAPTLVGAPEDSSALSSHGSIRDRKIALTEEHVFRQCKLVVSLGQSN